MLISYIVVTTAGEVQVFLQSADDSPARCAATLRPPVGDATTRFASLRCTTRF